MFRSQDKPGTPPAAAAGDRAAIYHGLRGQVLGLDPASVGLAQGPERPQVWGALMDMGFPSGTATLATARGPQQPPSSNEPQEGAGGRDG